ncbi:MAG: hypothetical protein KDA32_13160 [Phycisphaerales bacterium]|nr:hypothetical protein [Phycisphaerales bacterium]
MALVCVCGVAAFADPARFDNHLLVEVEVSSPAELAELEARAELLECRARIGANRFVVSPDHIDALDGRDYKILHTNVQALIDAEAADRAAARSLRGPDFFADFATYAEVNAYIDTLVALRPDIATKVQAGTSLEGRAIWGLVLQSPVASPSQRPQFVISGCQHAREWISPMAVMYVADRIVRNYGSDADITALLDAVEFHFIPIVNPDGYVYSHTTNRLWRKNRRPNGTSTGVDLNRNWSIGWGSNSSSSGSAEDYRGTAPFSEPESTSVRDYMSTLTNMRGHLDVHSYSQLILGPWAHTSSPSPRRDELFPVSRKMGVVMLATHGVTYDYGFGDDVLYLAGGAMPDWTFDRGALSWTYELRDDGSQYGFILPANQIIPNSEEVFAGMLVIADAIQRDVEFTFPKGRPIWADADTPTSVDVTLIQWNENLIEPNSVRVFSRIGTTGAFNEAAPALNGLSFAASLPAISCGQTAQYYFTAHTTDGRDVRNPSDPNTTYELHVGDATVELADDFEQDTGWQASATAVDGQWQRGVPAGGGDRADPPTDYDGSGAAYVTDNADGNSDVDNGEVILESPPLDLSEGGRLTWAYWQDSLATLDGSDYMIVEYATDVAGTNWTYHRAYETPLDQWRTDALSVGGDIPASPTFRIRFVARDVGNGDVVEAAIDAFEAIRYSACAAPPCVGDLDGSGMVDLADLSGLLGAFGVCSGDAAYIPAADLDSSGCIDLPDLSGLLAIFGVSCE